MHLVFTSLPALVVMWAVVMYMCITKYDTDCKIWYFLSGFGLGLVSSLIVYLFIRGGL